MIMTVFRRRWIAITLTCLGAVAALAMTITVLASAGKGPLAGAGIGGSDPEQMPPGAEVAVTVSMNVPAIRPELGKSYLHVISVSEGESLKKSTGGLMSGPLSPDDSGGFWFSEVNGEGHAGEILQVWSSDQDYYSPWSGVVDTEANEFQSFKNEGFSADGYSMPIRAVPSGKMSMSNLVQEVQSPEQFVTGSVYCGGSTVIFGHNRLDQPRNRAPVYVYQKSNLTDPFEFIVEWEGGALGESHDDSWSAPVCFDGVVHKLVMRTDEIGSAEGLYLLKYNPVSHEITHTNIEYTAAGGRISDHSGEPKFGVTSAVFSDTVKWVTSEGDVFSAPLAGGEAVRVAEDLMLTPDPDHGFTCRFAGDLLACLIEDSDEVRYEVRRANMNFEVLEKRHLPELDYVLKSKLFSFRTSDVLPLKTYD